jgi:hypothetical protein
VCLRRVHGCGPVFLPLLRSPTPAAFWISAPFFYSIWRDYAGLGCWPSASARPLAPAASAGLTQPSGMHRLLPVFPMFFSCHCAYALVIGSVLLSCAQRYWLASFLCAVLCHVHVLSFQQYLLLGSHRRLSLHMYVWVLSCEPVWCTGSPGFQYWGGLGIVKYGQPLSFIHAEQKWIHIKTIGLSSWNGDPIFIARHLCKSQVR